MSPKSRVRPIDWREEFDALAPCFETGGIVRIFYNGKAAAHSAFLDALKSTYEAQENTRSLRIDKHVFSVRYLSGIFSELARKLNVSLAQPKAFAPQVGALNILSDLDVGGSVTANISDVTQNIFLQGPDSDQQYVTRTVRASGLVEAMREFLRVGRFMIVMNHGSADDQDEFWRYLWCDGLDALVEDGLLLVHMVDRDDLGGAISPLAPMEMVQVTLPTHLNPRAAGFAAEDITQILREAVPAMSDEEAGSRADALVDSNYDDIPKLHRAAAQHIMKLAQQYAKK
ncbi:hypothetical protein KDX16_21005 [Burkholderia vietnamiensis]|uniref:hypothetical protein n=1 Tax=Burkholderia vietnamiensis TaxID=60552 RepID=UPI001B8FD077|nr:hypothetical protein [Burkholderia vietnamiensis]MBR7918268.1 hypothetical protein [Burkholderia vietnamiensis]